MWVGLLLPKWNLFLCTDGDEYQKGGEKANKARPVISCCTQYILA